MTYEFGKLSTDKRQVVQILFRGQPYKNTSFGMNATDAEYISKGLLPIRSEFPQYDNKTQHYTHELVIHENENYIERVYTIIDFTLEERQTQLLSKIKEIAFAYENSRPRVPVLLDSGCSTR